MEKSLLPTGLVSALPDGAELPRGVHPFLIKAYREARYVVDHSTDPLVLSVGRVCVALRSLMSGYGVTTAAVLTAFNPGSVLCSDEVNFSAQAELVKWLDEQGYVMFDGRGEDNCVGSLGKRLGSRIQGATCPCCHKREIQRI